MQHLRNRIFRHHHRLPSAAAQGNESHPHPAQHQRQQQTQTRTQNPHETESTPNASIDAPPADYDDEEDPTAANKNSDVKDAGGHGGFTPSLSLKCGPLLRFTGIEAGVWRGSLMVVTEDGGSVYEPVPEVRVFTCVGDVSVEDGDRDEDGGGSGSDAAAGSHTVRGRGKGKGHEGSELRLIKLSRTGRALGIKPAGEVRRGVDYSRNPEIDEGGLFYEVPAQQTPSTPDHNHQEETLTPIRLLTERAHTFWRFHLSIPQHATQPTTVYYRLNASPALHFHVPAANETMHIMFHSCNGFSLGVETGAFSGPDPLWRDVLRSHTASAAGGSGTGTKGSMERGRREGRPFNVMLGGGDQIYNDACRLQAPSFGRWTEETKNLLKRRAKFSRTMQDELEVFYLNHYLWWFSQGLFSVAAAHIPMLNIWDDHDIIDGYGSYAHRTMSSPVFRGLGVVACKYYLLFQHQSLPLPLVMELEHPATDNESSWVLGNSPGPYIDEVSRSVFVGMGERVAFLGVDCRMERCRKRVVYRETWEISLERCRKEIVAGRTKHFIVLLGVPLIYPRLSPLETLFSSKAIAPLKALGRAGLFGSLFNKFDGGVELLDDLDDHWTTRHHRAERASFITALQDLSRDRGVRVTVLGGDVHLAAIGAFRTATSSRRSSLLRQTKGKKKRHGQDAVYTGAEDTDYRFMANVISSAIANRAPASRVADIMDRCDRVHYLDCCTEESMMPIFGRDVDGRRRRNVHLLPRRNWCDIEECFGEGMDGMDGVDGVDGDIDGGVSKKEKGKEKTDVHRGKSNLKVQLRVEIDQGDPAGWTRGYEIVVPGLAELDGR